MITAAAVQHAPVFLDRARSVDKAIALIAEAAGAGAQLVVFPETWLPAYPFWVYGGGFHDEGVRHVAIGINELGRRGGGTIYNSLLYTSDAGDILGVHRKLMPTGAERTVWGQGDGSTCTSSTRRSAASAA